MDFGSLLHLLCTKDFSGVPCYSQLPLTSDAVSYGHTKYLRKLLIIYFTVSLAVIVPECAKWKYL